MAQRVHRESSRVTRIRTIHTYLANPIRGFDFAPADFAALAAAHPDWRLVHHARGRELRAALPEAEVVLSWVFKAEWYADAPNLRAVWTREQGQQPFAIVTYDLFREVEVAKEAKGTKEAKKKFVLLPHLVQTEVIHAQSDPVVGKWKRAPETRLMRVEKYELNPEVAVRFVPPAATHGKGMGFERRTLATVFSIGKVIFLFRDHFL